MRTTGSCLSLLFLFALGTLPLQAGDEPPDYPRTRRGNHVDDYFGTKVADPYRWLEQDVRESEEVAGWVNAQNAVTFAYLNTIPERKAIRARLMALWDYERYSSPYKEGGLYFYRKNNGLQDQSVLYVMKNPEKGARVLLDPNTWSDDGTRSLAGTASSEDGKYLAYGVSEAGSDWETWRIMEIATGRLLDEEIRWVKWSFPAWTLDGRGFFYSRYDAPKEGEEHQGVNLNQKLFYHRIGTPQSEDVLSWATPEHPEWGFNGYTTLDGRWLVITVWKGTEPKYRVVYRDLFEPYQMPIVLMPGFKHEFSFIECDGPVFYFKTDLDAPRGRVIAVDVRNPARENWKEILPEEKNPLRSVTMVGNLLVARRLKDAATEVRIHTLKGKFVREVALPGLGSAWGFWGKRTDPDTFYTFSSFDTPPTIYRYDMLSGKSTLFRRPNVKFDPDAYEAKQVFFASRDGTRVPMFVVHRKGIALDGSHPTLLTGYGGFNISITPRFSITAAIWMEMGGVVAKPNLRGGGEYGKTWHDAGKGANKQNVFDDFIAAAEWLIEKGYTNPKKLAVKGGSNGGLLVGAVVNQRPDLFAVALSAVGVMDMLRYHRFTSGRFWTDEYGSSDDAEQFKVLRAYSPYHNLQAGTKYPAVLVTTADTDDRVVPAHSFKYAAALQHAQASEAPVLIRIETKAGHGGGKPMKKVIEEITDEFAFLVKNLGMKLDRLAPEDGAPGEK